MGRFLSRRGFTIGLAVAISAAALPSLAAPARADEPDAVEVSLGVYRQPLGPCDFAWRQEFRNAQGRDPGDEDCLDRVWSLRFAAMMGHEPGPGDWERRLRRADPVDEDTAGGDDMEM